jgi:hypothetical protein
MVESHYRRFDAGQGLIAGMGVAVIQYGGASVPNALIYTYVGDALGARPNTMEIQ